MSGVNFTTIKNGENPDAETWNKRLRQLDAALEGIKGSGAALGSPAISTFTDAQHDHEDAAGGEQLTDGALSTALTLAKGGTGSDLSATGTGRLLQASNGANVSVSPDDLAATSAPGADDDSGDGYAVGSRWIRPAEKQIFHCLDASLAAAVWRQCGAKVLLAEDIDPYEKIKIDIENWAGAGQGWFSMLELEFLRARTDNASAFDSIKVRCNDDAGNNYVYQTLYGTNVTPSAGESLTNNGMMMPGICGVNADTFFHPLASIRIILPDDVSGYRTYLSRGFAASSTSGELRAAMAGGAWKNTADKITKLTCVPGSGNYFVWTKYGGGTHWRLWGIV